MKAEFFLIFITIFIYASCAAPPPPKPIEIIIIDSPPIIKKENISPAKSFKNLDSIQAKQILQNSTSIVHFYKDYKTEEHEMIIVPQDLPDGYIFTYWSFNMGSSGINLDEFINSCQIIDKNGAPTQDINCNASTSFNSENSRIYLIYNYSLDNTEKLKINIKYERQLDNEVLYKTENAVIPFIQGFSFCNYTYILPEGYKNLGLTQNILTKESNNIYTYFGNCPQETIFDIIHFSPEKTYWKAEAKTFLNNTQKIKYDATFYFPRYYRGGKLNNTFYKITSSKNESYKEDTIVYNDLKFKVDVPTPNQETVSANLNTGFINDLNGDFKVYIPESYYAINDTDIPQEIKSKVQEIINNNPDKPYYYSIGKFINSYMTYNISYLGKTFTAKQIYDNKQGVCEHYTILYNTMLNSIGIKSLYISGWAFQRDEISGNQDTIGHAWTVALIDNKWIELDATWGLFEGIPSGHIFKTFLSDSYSYSWSRSEEGNIKYGQNRTIQLYEDINDILEKDINPLSTNNDIYYSTTESDIISTDEINYNYTLNQNSTDIPSEDINDFSTDEKNITASDESNKISSEEINEITSEELDKSYSEKIVIPLEKSSQILSEKITYDYIEISNNAISEQLNDITSDKYINNLSDSIESSSEKLINISSTENINDIYEKLSTISFEEDIKTNSEEIIDTSTSKIINAPSNEESSILSSHKKSDIPEELNNTVSEENNSILSELSSITLSEKISTISSKVEPNTTLEILSTILSEEKNNTKSELPINNSSVYITSILSKETTNIPNESNEISSKELINSSTNKNTNIIIETTSKNSNEEILKTQSEESTKASIIKETNTNSVELTQNSIAQQNTNPLVIPTNSPTNIPVTIPKTIPITQTNTPITIKTTIPSTSIEPNDDNENITLAFRQLQNFTQNDKYDINFDFYVLTANPKSKIPKSISVSVNLIKLNGEREDETKISYCILNKIKDMDYANEVHYICTINNLTEKYYSFRFNNSEYISNVPDDEISLDPHMTEKYIKENKIIDALKNEILPIFTIKLINHDSCKKNGIFIMHGNISKELSQSFEFIMPLKEPQGIKAICNIIKNQIECKVDREINNNKIIIEEYIIKNNSKEIFFITGAETENEVTCKDKLYEESSIKKNNTISFRQISHLTRIKNGFEFYLITLISKTLKKEYQLYILINIYINKIKVEKKAICILENDASPKNGDIVQGNFKCTVNLNNDEYKKADFKTISISSNNFNISGVADLDEILSNPYRTDELIKEVENKKSQGFKMNKLKDIIDYYFEKDIKAPIFNIDSISINDCQKKGKIYLIGELSDDISEKIKFNLPLLYPNSEIKCELDKANKNSKMNITCKTQKQINSFNKLIIEPRLIKKKNQEILFIKGKEINFSGKVVCDNYNTIGIKIAKKRQNSLFTFLQLNKYNPIKNGLNFFMTILKTSYEFYKKFSIPVKIKISIKKILRNLDEENQITIPMSCHLNETLKTDVAAGYECSNSAPIIGTPSGVKIMTDEIEDISGIPENLNPEEIKNNIDYSNLNNLKSLDNLAIINITNINGDSCGENGQYIITGERIDKTKGILDKTYKNVEIRFSFPESSGLCQIDIDKKIIMICENKEQFEISQILIERNIVKDQKGNGLFIINSFINREVFGCDISNNSIIIPDEPNEYSPTKNIAYYNSKKKGGLTGGAIAAIIICSIVIVAVVVLLVILLRKRTPSGKKTKANFIPTELSGEIFDVKNI